MYPSPKLLKSLLSSKPFPLLWWATDGRRNLWALGLILPVALGVFASAVGILMGPLLQIVQAPLDTRHAWTTILGPVWGTWAASYHGSTQVSGYDLLLLIPMTLVICVTGKALLTGLHWYLWEFMGELASKNLRLLLAQSHIGLRPEFRLTAEGQDIETHLSSAMTLDIRMMREFMVHYYGGLPREFFQALMLLGSLTLLSWRLTVLFIGVILPLGFAVRAIGKRIRRRAQDVLKHQSELTEWLQQRLMGIETIKHYQTESLEAEKFVAFNSQLSKKFARAIATKVRTSPTIELFATFAFVLVLVYSLEKIHTQTLSGSLFLSFFATLSLLSQSGSKLGRYYNSNKEGNEAVRRLKKLLKVFFDNQEMQNGSEERPEIDPSVVPKHLNPAVFTLYCHQLTVFYPGSSEPALRAITYGFLPGKIYCLKGASGSGKSTLFKALLGIIRPSSMGKTPMIGWGEALKKHPYPVSYMPQRFVPLNAPLFDHVVYPLNPELGDKDRVFESLAKVGLKDLIHTLPEGVFTLLGSEGRHLSGGQLQRVLLARLFYHCSPLILVDEGTSALDPEVERMVHGFLRDLANQGSTIILIAHRLSQIAFADRVLTLDKGLLLQESMENL